MSDYQVLLTNVLSGAVLEELPTQEFSWSRVLNSPGSASVTVTLDQPAKNLAALKTLLPGDIGRLGLVVERDGVILWGGMPWTWSADLAQGVATLSAEGWHSYVRRRVLRTDLTFLGADQTSDIAAGLINATQSTDRAPVISTDDVVASGVTRDRTYTGIDRNLIGHLIEDLAAVENGFDFRYETVRSDDIISAQFLTMFPNTGRITPLVFEIGGSVTEASISVDATNLATTVDEIGAGEGDDGIRFTTSNANIIGTYPLLDVVESRTDVTETSTLNTYARQRLGRGQMPITLPKISVNPNAEPIIGSYIEGDIVRVRGGYGLAQIDDLFRIVQIDGSVTRDEGEKVDLTFSAVGSFQAIA